MATTGATSASVQLKGSRYLFSTQADYRGIAECLLGLALTLSSVGRPSVAARLFGAAEALLLAIGSTPWPTNIGAVQAGAGLRPRAQLGDTGFTEAGQLTDDGPEPREQVSAWWSRRSSMPAPSMTRATPASLP